MAIGLKTIIKYVLFLIIGFLVLFLAFRNQNLHTLLQEIKTANLFWIAVSALSVFLSHILRALRWQMLYKSLSFNVGLFNVYNAVIIGYLANLALPRFGEVVRCSVIHKTNKVSMFSSIGTVITERLFDVMVLLLSSLAMLVFQYDKVADFLYSIVVNGILKKNTFDSYLLIVALIVTAVLTLFLLVFFLKKRFKLKFLKVYASLKQGITAYGKVKNKVLFIAYTFGIWFSYFLSMYLCFFAIQSTSNLGLDATFTAIVFSGFAMVAPVQGGIGVFHWMVAQSLVLYGLSFKDGLAYATIIHSSQLVLTLFLGALSLIFVSLKKQ